MLGSAYEYRSAAPSGSHEYLYPAVEHCLRDLPSGSRLLDLGCGNGSFLARFRGRGWTLSGLDFAPEGIKIACRTFPEIEFLLGDVQSSKAALQHAPPFNAVISTEVIEHLYDPRTFLQNVYDLLEPGGRLILSTPYHGPLKNLVLALTGKFDDHFNVHRLHGHIKFFSRKTLSRMLRDEGFTVRSFHGVGRVPFIWKSMVLLCERPADR